jgi:hypothetical protein
MKKYLVIFIALAVAMMVCVAVASADEYPVEPGKVIDYGEIGQITELGGHPVQDGTAVIQPTCTEDGVARFECLNPAAHAQTTAWHYVRIAPLGHLMSSRNGGDNWGRMEVPPTCTEPGFAVDICERPNCGYEDWENLRRIEPKGHTFLMDVFNVPVEAEPKCNRIGLGVRYCIHGCGVENPTDLENLAKALAGTIEWTAAAYGGPTVPMVDHKWSEWRTEVPSTCAAYGRAIRTCVWCGDSQILDKDHVSVMDHGTEIKINNVIPKLNNGWETAAAYLHNKEFKSEEEEIQAYRAADAAIKAAGLLPLSADVTKNWLMECYAREITLHCNCGCNGATHADMKYKQVAPYTISHTWVAAAEGALTPANTTAATILDEDGDDVWFLNDDKSLAPTCTMPGFILWLCKYDDVHHHNPGQDAYGYGKDLAFYKDYLPALGHDWGPWREAERFTVDGEEYVKRLCTCQRAGCGAVQNEVIKVSDIPPEPEKKNGLVLDPDGIFRYYKDGEFYPLTNIVRYDGGEFWVVEGEVPLNATGVTVCPDGKAYFLVAGQIVRVSGVEEYQNEWFIINNGLVDTNANGLFDYNGGKFVFAAGKLRRDVNGLWQNPQDNKWYFMANGELQKVSQVAGYNGQYFVIKDGILDESYNGTIEYDGATFRVVKGQLYPMND